MTVLKKNAKIVRNIRVGSSNFGVGDVTGPVFGCSQFDGTPITEIV